MSDSPQLAAGFLRGTGAALNVELGWIPDFVLIFNLTGGDVVWANALKQVIAFTSGSTEIKAGDKLHGNTSDATAIVDQVIVDSGSWAGGDAAGWFVLRPTTRNGNFSAAETAYREGVDSDGDDRATLTAVQDQDGLNIDTEVAATTTAATNVSEYAGSAGSASKGFTVGATISENANLLYFVAVRGDSRIDFTSAP